MLVGTCTYLRAVERGDLPQLLTWRNDPALRRYFREYRELSMAQQTAWFEHVVLGDARVQMFAVLDESQTLIGTCGLCYIHAVSRSADFSFYIGKDGLYIDEKYAPDAACTLLRYAFGERHLHRLWAEIYTFDIQKKAFFEALGFTLEGRHRETHWSEDAWHDSLFFGLLETEDGARAR